MKLSIKISVIMACFLLLATNVSCASAWEYLWNDEITLAVKTIPLRSEDCIQVDISASISPEVVSVWGDDCLPALRIDGSPNLNRGRPRGYRVAMQVQAQNQKIPLQVIQAGAGPLSDRLGVFPTPIGRSIVIQQRSVMKSSFRHMIEDPAEYKITWWVDCKPVRDIILCLPEDKIIDALDTPPSPVIEDDAENTVIPLDDIVNNKVIKTAILCEKADARGKPVGSGNSFARGISSLCLILQINSAARSTISLNMSKTSKEICLYEIETEGTGYYLIDLESATAAGYAPGDYLIILNVNNRTEHKIPFIIR